jgi:hypothetical protein
MLVVDGGSTDFSVAEYTTQHHSQKLDDNSTWDIDWVQKILYQANHIIAFPTLTQTYSASSKRVTKTSKDDAVIMMLSIL